MIASEGKPPLGNWWGGAELRLQTSSSSKLGFLSLKHGGSAVILRSKDLLQIKAIEGSRRVSVNGKAVDGGDRKILNDVLKNGHPSSGGNSRIQPIMSIGTWV